MKIETLLHEEIKTELEELNKIELGSEKYKVTVDGIVKLIDRTIEMDKLNIDVQNKADDREKDDSFKMKQMEDERKNRLVNNYIAVAGIVIPTAVTIWGTIKTIEFEKEGTITTIMGRGFINKLLPKK